VPPELRIETAPFDHPDAAALRAAQRTELAVRYGTPDSEPGPAPTAADTAVFLLARDVQGRAVGCGALRELGEGLGEVKRMYVVSERRRSGLHMGLDAPAAGDGNAATGRHRVLRAARLPADRELRPVRG
jgi:hypothetical protein